MVISTVERIEDALVEAGFSSPVPLNEKLFAAGDGDVIEDAPIGYYRFHYWKTDLVPKEHDNYLAMTKEAGPIVVSVIRSPSNGNDSSYYRLLIRTIFGFKSLILTDEVLSGIFGGSKPSGHQLLTIAMHHFVGSEREKVLFSGLDEASSFRSGMSGMSARSQRTRFLPHSRLKASEGSPKANTAETNTGSSDLDFRSNSIRRKSSVTTSPGLTSSPSMISIADHPVNQSGSNLTEEFRAFSRIKSSDLAKMLTKIDDESFSQTLLSMESSLLSSRFTVDIVKFVSSAPSPNNNNTSKNWEAFNTIIGGPIESSVYLQQSVLKPKVIVDVKPSPKIMNMTIEEARLEQSKPIADLIEKEKNYVEILNLMDLHIYQELSKRSIIKPADLENYFGQIPGLLHQHKGLLEKIDKKEASGLYDVKALANGLIASLKFNPKFCAIYKRYCSDQSEREKEIKKEYETNQSFSGFIDEIYNKKIFKLQKLDQLMMSPVQRITRYKLQIEDIIKNTHPEDDALPLLKEAFDAASSLASYIDSVVERNRGLVQILALNNKVKGFSSSGLVSKDRFIIGKIGVTETGSSKQKHTIYLFSDAIMLAKKLIDTKSNKKKSNKNGTVERKFIIGTHELVFCTTVQSLKIVETANYLELSIVENDGILAVSPKGCQEYYRMTVNNKEKLPRFMSAYLEIQRFAANKCAKASMHVVPVEGREAIFNVYEGIESYMESSQKSPILFLYLDDLPIPQLDIGDASLKALGVIQTRNETFRSFLKYRGMLYASQENFMTFKEFVSPSILYTGFLKTVSNCSRLLEIYPPFDASIMTQRRSQLESLGHAYGDSVKFKIKSLASFKWKSGKSKLKADADELAQQIWEDSMSVLATSMDDLAVEEESHNDNCPRGVENPFGGPLQTSPKNGSTGGGGGFFGRKKSTSGAPSPLQTRTSPLTAACTSFDDSE